MEHRTLHPGRIDASNCSNADKTAFIYTMNSPFFIVTTKSFQYKAGQLVFVGRLCRVCYFSKHDKGGETYKSESDVMDIEDISISDILDVTAGWSNNH